MTAPDPQADKGAETSRGSSLSLLREVAAVAAQASVLREVLAEWLSTLGVSDRLADDIRLAVYEAMANVVEHAYPAREDGTMTLAAHLEPGFLTIVVSDTGHWREGPARPSGGRGLPMIRAVVPEAAVTSTPTGTTVRMVWPWVAS
ncbi:ATP-binding protein [Saccharothrix sp. AJ9571]|nr:ATP-binding protein [Saccharothrix sp. AJ9571]